jgi:hypothetical protein
VFVRSFVLALLLLLVLVQQQLILANYLSTRRES